MPVFKPKTRMVSFRLSEDEYQSLKQNSVVEGARSVSDYARVIVCRVVTGSGDINAVPASARIEEIDQRMSELDQEVQRLARLIDGNGSST